VSRIYNNSDGESKTHVGDHQRSPLESFGSTLSAAFSKARSFVYIFLLHLSTLDPVLHLSRGKENRWAFHKINPNAFSRLPSVPPLMMDRKSISNATQADLVAVDRLIRGIVERSALLFLRFARRSGSPPAEFDCDESTLGLLPTVEIYRVDAARTGLLARCRFECTPLWRSPCVFDAEIDFAVINFAVINDM